MTWTEIFNMLEEARRTLEKMPDSDAALIVLSVLEAVVEVTAHDAHDHD